MAFRAVMSYESINFLDTTPKVPATPTWALMNKGIESGTVAFNPITNERHFIADKNQTQEVAGFAKTLDVKQFAYKEDPTFEFIDGLFFNEAIGAEAKTNLLQVFLYKSESKTEEIPAKLTPVTIAIGEHAVEGGEQLQLGYNVLFSGDSVKGKVTITEGAPVFTPDAV